MTKPTPPPARPVERDAVVSNTAGAVAVGALCGLAYIVWIPLVLLVVALVAGMISWRFR